MFTDKERMQELIRQEIQRRKKRNLKVAGIVLASICAIALFFTTILPGIKSAIFIWKYGKEIYDVVGLVEEGRYIKFGKYEQDNNLANGGEDIEWYVLKVEKDKALVISKYVLDCQPYHTESVKVSWQNTSIRKWLNDTFINNAFSQEEQELIPTSRVPVRNKYYEQTDPYYRTQDKVFLLGPGEIGHYFNLFEDIYWYEWYKQINQPNRGKCQATAYAQSKGATLDKEGYCYWWECCTDVLDTGNNSCFINENSWGRFDVTTTTVGVRPALWIDLKP